MYSFTYMIIYIYNKYSKSSFYSLQVPSIGPLSTSYLFIVIMIIRAINNWVMVRVSCSEYSGLEREVNSQHTPSSAYPVFSCSSSVHVSGTAQPTMTSTAVWVRYEGSVNMISAMSGNLANMECAVEMFWVQLSSPLSFLLVLISGLPEAFPSWAGSIAPGHYPVAPFQTCSLPHYPPLLLHPGQIMFP